MLPKCWPDNLKTAISGIFPVLPTAKKFFTRNGYHCSLYTIDTHLSLSKKSQKTNDKILRKVQKTVISGIFPAFSPGKIFFSKIGLRHILGITILHHCAKNQKILMSQSREKLVTDRRTNGRTNERTNGQRLIYRTSPVGPKIWFIPIELVKTPKVKIYVTWVSKIPNKKKNRSIRRGIA